MMKRSFAVMALLIASVAQAQVQIENNTLGSGNPGVSGFTGSDSVLQNDIFHSPQYMPFYPTAATIWPRVVEVPCVKSGAGLKCEGYRWTPRYGRGEYLFFTPVVQEQVVVPQPEPKVIVREVLKEVPVKPKRQ